MSRGYLGAETDDHHRNPNSNDRDHLVTYPDCFSPITVLMQSIVIWTRAHNHTITITQANKHTSTQAHNHTRTHAHKQTRTQAHICWPGGQSDARHCRISIQSWASETFYLNWIFICALSSCTHRPCAQQTSNQWWKAGKNIFPLFQEMFVMCLFTGLFMSEVVYFRLRHWQLLKIKCNTTSFNIS